jgi:hypothetical protein
MKVCVFGWMPREKPPYFGGMPTWVFLKKFNLKNLSEEKIKKILKEIDEEAGADRYKIIVYDEFGRWYSHYYEVVE